MDYTAKTLPELQTIRLRFMTALGNDRLNATNRVSIEGWIGQIEAELIKQAPVAKPVAKVASIRAMRNGTETPQTAGDRERLAMSFMS